jgi:hypothetical protein
MDILSKIQFQNPEFFQSLQPIIYRLACGQAISQSILNYAGLLFLLHQHPALVVVPTQDIDHILHTHLSDANYAQDCRNLFGGTMLHYPEVDNASAFSKTSTLFAQEFQVSYSGHPAACEVFMQPGRLKAEGN